MFYSADAQAASRHLKRSQMGSIAAGSAVHNDPKSDLCYRALVRYGLCLTHPTLT